MIRSEIARAVLLVATHHAKPGKLFLRIKTYADVGLVVTKPHIVLGLVGFDKTVLEQQSLFFRVHHQILDGSHPTHEKRDAVPAVRLIDIITQTRTQVLGLAHIQHLSALVAHEIAPGAGRRRADVQCRRAFVRNETRIIISGFVVKRHSNHPGCR